MDIQDYQDWFLAYAARFGQKQPKDQENIDLKVDHSLRVLAEARGITAHGGFGPEAARLVHLCALLHDVGRFSQYDRFKTYCDPLSVDHGDLGREVLESEDILDGLDGGVRTIILEAVRLHNKKELPDDLGEPLGRITRAVRDADKLDIVPVVLAKLAPGAPDNPVIRLGLDPDPVRFTPSVFDQVAAREMVEYTSMRFVNDFKLLLVSWSYALSFSWTRGQVLERGYLDRLFGLLPGDAPFVRLREGLIRDLKGGIADKEPE
ncbi:HD domain-containing protein [Desulfoplanes sp.]